MADNNMVTFGYLSESELKLALSKKLLTKWSVVYTSDSKRQFLIDEDLNAVAIKSKVPVFSSRSSAITSINVDASTYEGEIVSIYNDDHFEAYVVNKSSEGVFTVKAINEKEEIDYNKINNIPIINLPGTITEPIDLTTLDDGYYKVNFFTNPITNGLVKSYVGNIIVVDTENGIKFIKRITNKNIYDYTVKDGIVTENKYITEQYIIDNHYQTEESIDIKLKAFEIAFEKKVEEYVNDKVRLLVKFIVEEELDNRYASEADINGLFV